jgi:hypothetical protein
VSPPASTGYQMTTDAGITLAPSATERGGVQPVVHLSVNGAARAEVKVGEPVRLVGFVEQPGDGSIVTAEWDFLGNGKFEPGSVPVARSVTVEATYSYEKPGTYFACSGPAPIATVRTAIAPTPATTGGPASWSPTDASFRCARMRARHR